MKYEDMKPSEQVLADSLPISVFCGVVFVVIHVVIPLLTGSLQIQSGSGLTPEKLALIAFAFGSVLCFIIQVCVVCPLFTLFQIIQGSFNANKTSRHQAR